MANPFIPNLSGKGLHPTVEQAIRNLYIQVGNMQTPTQSAGPRVSTPSPAPAPAITGPLGPAGNAPFPQTPQIPILNDTPPTGSPYNIPGTLILINKVPYIFYNGAWVTYPPA